MYCRKVEGKNWGTVSVKKLSEFAQDLPDGKVAQELLVSKGCHLENVLLKSCKIIKSLLCFIGKKNSAFSVKCGHTVNLIRYQDAVKCQDCVSVFRTFVDEIANKILFKVENHQIREMRVKVFGDLLIKALNIGVNIKGGN